MCLTGWSVAQEHYRGLYSYNFSSLCTPQTSSSSKNPVIYRNTQMTAVVECTSGGQGVVWCGNNHLVLNESKTKQIFVDFRSTRIKLNSISIMGEKVEVMDEYKYLCVHLDNILNWKCNSDAVYKKGQSRLYV